MKRLSLILTVLLCIFMFSADNSVYAKNKNFDGKYGPDIIENRVIINELCSEGIPHYHILYYYSRAHEVDIVVALYNENQDSTWSLESYFYSLNNEFWGLRLKDGKFTKINIPDSDINLFMDDMKSVLNDWLSKQKLGGV